VLARRIIPCLDIKDGRTVKGVHFVQIRDAGDPVELAQRYRDEGADELVFLDITASVEQRQALLSVVEAVAKVITIPFTVGGGIRALDDARRLVSVGADKVSLNSSAVLTPSLIDSIASELGSQCAVVAVDVKCVDGVWKVFVQGGRKETELEALPWIREAVDRGAGEILLTSMDHDGAKRGFANELLREVTSVVKVPVIASGGAGAKVDFYDAFVEGGADAALAASVFHFGEIALPDLKRYLFERGVSVRL
jgi:imidazole glycerol-phosphate synthase subunit HisF